MKFSELCMLVNENTFIEVNVDWFGLQMKTRHQAVYFISQPHELGDKRVLSMRVKDETLIVYLDD